MKSFSIFTGFFVFFFSLFFSAQREPVDLLWKLNHDIAVDRTLAPSERLEALGRAMEINKKTSVDSLKSARYSQLARLALQLESPAFFEVANLRANKVAKKLSNQYLLGDTHWNWAEGFLSEQMYDSAYVHYKKAHAFFEECPHPYYAAKMLYNMGYIKSRITDYVGSEVLLFQALEVFLDLKREKQVFQSYNLLGSVYDDLKEYGLALEYYEKARKHSNRLSDRESMDMDIENNIGLIYQKLDRQQDAIETYDLILAQTDLFISDPLRYARSLDNRAYSSFLFDGRQEVENDLLTAFAIRESLSHWPGIVMSQLHLSSFYLKSGNTEEALNFARMAYRTSKRMGLKRDKLQALQLLAQGDTINSGLYLKEYIAVQDSIHGQQRKVRDQFARIHHETESYKEEIIYLFRQRTWWIGATFGLVALLMLLFIAMKQISKTRKMKFEAAQQQVNEELYLMRIKQLEKTEKAKSEERERISMALHDGILGRLFGLRMRWGFSDASMTEEQAEKQENQIIELHKLEMDIRSLSHDLKKDLMLSETTFIKSLQKALKEKAEIGDFEDIIEWDDLAAWEGLEMSVKINLMSIIEEGLQNIIKHAKAKQVYLRLIKEEGKLQIELQDDGIGFKPRRNWDGIGLRNMRSRAEKIGGSFEVRRLSRGSILIVRLGPAATGSV